MEPLLALLVIIYKVALQQLAFAYAIERLQVHRSEDDPRYVQTVQVSGQLFRIPSMVRQTSGTEWYTPRR